MPEVSVIIPTYNRAEYVVQAIDSVLMQETDFPIELVIGEDCSTDNTREIVIEYQREYPDIIRVLTSDKNVGMHKNSFRTGKASRGKYIAYCEGDDYWHRTDKLQIQVDYLESHSECGLVCSDFDVYNTVTKKCISNYGRFLGKTKSQNPSIIDILHDNAFIQTLTVVVRHELIDKVHMEDTFLHQSGHFKMGDTQLWAELSLLAKVHLISDSLATHQILKESATRSENKANELRFKISGAEMCLYLCDKHCLPQYIKEFHEKKWRRRSLQLAFVEKRHDLADAIKQRFPDLTLKEWFWYQGTKSASMRPVTSLLQTLFQKKKKNLILRETLGNFYKSFQAGWILIFVPDVICQRIAGKNHIKDWSLRTMREKLVKIGAKVVSHARYVTFQMAEVLLSRSLFYEILAKIHRLKPAGIGHG